MWYVCDVMYAVVYVRVSCFVVCECAVSWGYIDVCKCDMFSVVNVYIDHLKLCGVCINGQMYGCCTECYVVSNEWDEPTHCLVHLLLRTDVKLCTSGVLTLGVSLFPEL